MVGPNVTDRCWLVISLQMTDKTGQIKCPSVRPCGVNIFKTLKPGTHWQQSRKDVQHSGNKVDRIGNNVETSWILMNTVQSKLIYLLHVLSHRNYATVSMEPELGWTDSRTLKFIDSIVTTSDWIITEQIGNKVERLTLFNKVERSSKLNVQQS